MFSKLTSSVFKQVGESPQKQVTNLGLCAFSTSNYPTNLSHGHNRRLAQRFRRIPYDRKEYLADYIWIGGTGEDVRSKSRLLSKPVKHPEELPNWQYDGSSTGQAVGSNSEVMLKPVRICPDPFRLNNHILVLCETFKDGEPLATNNRAFARKILEENEKVKSAKCWFGLEQEYTLLTPDGLLPLGFPQMGQPPPQGQYYCAAGVDNAFGRDISEAHLFACLYAGLDIMGTNAEVMPGQWEYQIGTVEGLDAADQMWISRFIMERICEEFQVKCSLEPKPLRGDWNGAGCHCNFSTEEMRVDGGMKAILDCMPKLEATHAKHMADYGARNEQRMTGAHETASYDNFSWGIANRGVSVRITKPTEKAGKGYFEDRRPASNCDPYLVMGHLANTCLLE